MTNAELIAKIKDKIERLISNHQPKNGFPIGYIWKNEAYCELLSFLSTLESEKPMQEGLEEEINRYLEPIHTADIQFEPFTQMTKCARHFAEWGAERQREQDDRLVDIIYQQGVEKGKDEIRKTLKRKEKK